MHVHEVSKMSKEDETSCGGSAPCPGALELYGRAVSSGAVTDREPPACLRAIGLLQRSSDDPMMWVPVAPATAETIATHQMELDLAMLRSAIATTRATYAAAESTYIRTRETQEAPQALLQGEKVINAVLEREIAKCAATLLTVQPGGGRPESVLREALKRDEAALRRGVSQCTLYQNTVRGHVPTLNYIKRVIQCGAEVRTLDELVDRLIVCDDRVAFIPASEIRRDAALEIRDPIIIRYLVAGFGKAWERAAPINTEHQTRWAPKVTSHLQKKIIHMVITGHTDTSIAGRLGVSPRTVAEHVRKVSALLGSRSRAELGFLVARSGWLDRTPS